MYFRAFGSSDEQIPTSTVFGRLHTNDSDCVRFDDPVSESAITIRLADTDRGRNEARMLLNRMYAWRGYGDQHEIGKSPSHMTFSASSEGKVMGTLTLAVDSDAGLGADSLFGDIIDTYRSRGAHVCELTRFAFDTAAPSKAILASLFHLVFIYGQREYGCTDLFIEVAPRHRRFYEVMLGFTTLSDVRFRKSVGSEAYLLWIDVAKIRENIDLHSRNLLRKSRSLYAYFFSAKEEDGLYLRMTKSRVKEEAPRRSGQAETKAKIVSGFTSKINATRRRLESRLEDRVEERGSGSALQAGQLPSESRISYG